jgi:hypothetical protein
MKRNKGIHLNRDQILLAVVDDGGLSQDLRGHLSTCPQCQADKKRVEDDLARFGQLAGSLAPLPKRPFSFPAEKQPQSSWVWSWSFKTALGLAIAAILIIFVMGEQAIFKITRSEKHDIQTQEIVEKDNFEDEELMTTISALSKNALPEEYRDIAVGSDPKIDEGFLEFIAPAIEDEPLSYRL